MNTSVAEKMETAVARPLNVLSPLIKDDLKKGNAAAESAGMPYYTSAGEKMIEAQEGNEWSMTRLCRWTQKEFKIGRSQTDIYIKLAKTAGYRFNGAPVKGKSFRSQRDFERRHLGRHRPVRIFRDWTAPVDDQVEKAKREAARLQDEHLTKEKERKAEYQLALRLIDIGFKVLAKELHPDKGGSKDAMSRLSRVRDRLKAHA